MGVVQGLTEFLPVSSSGHLVLFRQIFGVEAPPLLFDTMVHVGTLAAVFAVLWKDILAVLRKIAQPMTLFLIIGTIPAVAVALVFRDGLETAFETGNTVGFAFLGTSALLVTAETLSKRVSKVNPRRPGRMNWLDALIVGACQAIAVIPGVSRSGATLSGALSRGLDRDLAARFSFMLSIPIILGAALFQAVELLRGGGADAGADAVEACAIPGADGLAACAIPDANGAIALADGAVAGIGLLPIAVGTATAALVGFFAVRAMLKIVREKSLWGFAVYTGVLGALVLIDQFLLNLVF